MLNRCVVVVKAKQPFMEWLRSLPDPADLTLDQINQDNTVYLLPDYERDSKQRQILRQYFDLIFEDQTSITEPPTLRRFVVCMVASG